MHIVNGDKIRSHFNRISENFIVNVQEREKYSVDRFKMRNCIFLYLFLRLLVANVNEFQVTAKKWQRHRQKHNRFVCCLANDWTENANHHTFSRLSCVFVFILPFIHLFIRAAFISSIRKFTSPADGFYTTVDWIVFIWFGWMPEWCDRMRIMCKRFDSYRKIHRTHSGVVV